MAICSNCHNGARFSAVFRAAHDNASASHGSGVHQNARQQIDLVAGPPAGRHIAHLRLGLELGEHPFLGAAPVVEGQHFLGLQVLVRDDDLKIIAVFVRDEQIQLYGAF